MTPRERMWKAINRYVLACDGDPSKHVYGNSKRMAAVVDVERAVTEAVAAKCEACAKVAEKWGADYAADEMRAPGKTP